MSPWFPTPISIFVTPELCGSILLALAVQHASLQLNSYCIVESSLSSSTGEDSPLPLLCKARCRVPTRIFSIPALERFHFLDFSIGSCVFNRDILAIAKSPANGLLLYGTWNIATTDHLGNESVKLLFLPPVTILG